MKKMQRLKKKKTETIKYSKLHFPGTTVYFHYIEIRTKGNRNAVSQLKNDAEGWNKENQNKKWQKWIMQGWQKWRGGQDAAPRHCEPAAGSSIIMVIFLWPPPLHTEEKKRENRVEAENISPSSTARRKSTRATTDRSKAWRSIYCVYFCFCLCMQCWGSHFEI